MNFQIKEIILWPRNPDFEPRRLPFELGKLSVISGASRTGKSAVIPIIDYCLASNSCSIPVNTIRNACEWFGVVISTDQGEKLLARREPGAQKVTGDMFLLEQAEIGYVPRRLTVNTSAERVKRTLDELAGLTNQETSENSQQSGFEGRPSFRDMASFTFQPQNVIANPDIFFYKSSKYEHREKLRKTFPYILGAITPRGLALQHELRALQLELRRKSLELSAIERHSAGWIADLRSRFTQATELGLFPRQDVGSLTRDQMLTQFDELVQRTSLTTAVSEQTISDAVKELGELESEEENCSRQLTVLRRRLAEMNRAKSSTDAYNDGLRIRRERLQISRWLGEQRPNDAGCPICGSSMQEADESLSELQRALGALESSSSLNEDIPAAFEREIERVRAEITDASQRLSGVQTRKNALSNRSEEVKQRQFSEQEAARFVGNLENALSLHRSLGEDSELRAEVERLGERVRQLQSEVRDRSVEAATVRALDIVSNNAGRILPALDAERPNDPIKFDIDDLSINVVGIDRTDHLSEIGSGSNWLSYHLAVLLGFHEFFLASGNSPVPSFLVLDQPSQVYFPKRAVVRETVEEEEPQLTDQDVVAVRRIYEALGAATNRAQGKLQVIVLDHAAVDVWGGATNVSENEEWRDGKKLVPVEWL